MIKLDDHETITLDDAWLDDDETDDSLMPDDLLTWWVDMVTAVA